MGQRRGAEEEDCQQWGAAKCRLVGRPSLVLPACRTPRLGARRRFVPCAAAVPLPLDLLLLPPPPPTPLLLLLSAAGWRVSSRVRIRLCASLRLSL